MGIYNLADVVVLGCFHNLNTLAVGILDNGTYFLRTSVRIGYGVFYLHLVSEHSLAIESR
jgi:hypothetical protein